MYLYKYRGGQKNKLTTTIGSVLNSTDPIETKLNLEIMMHLLFIKIK